MGFSGACIVVVCCGAMVSSGFLLHGRVLGLLFLAVRILVMNCWAGVAMADVDVFIFGGLGVDLVVWMCSGLHWHRVVLNPWILRVYSVSCVFPQSL